ncbi:restriction endonuclease subunit S [Gemmiger formicilis]|uniref:restriction endonuclease subunit S n=1 Tax=Gemmiger formicilis TaxID=745368 RepID=UPI00195DF81C|nr:restriction endonuclease subunit S [Gemmiger formicilis]MBM6914163.1 restriction endonuclease subunit S [Gemmiger formicilis]
MAKLGDVCKKETSNIAQKDLEGRRGNFPIYGASGFIANVDFYQQESPYIAVVKDGAGIGRVMKLPAKSSVIGTMQYIIPNDAVDISYLAYAMEHMNLSKYFTGATIPHIYFKDYQKEELPLPPLDEQRKIAAVMDKVSDLIAKRRQQLDKLDEMVKSRFVEMFGDPVSNSLDLSLLSLSQLGEFGRGVSKHRPRNAPELLGGKYPLIQTGEVANSKLYISSYENTYSELGFKQSKMWKSGTLCITIAANIAKTAILTFDACFPDSVVGFTANEKTNNIFIHYWFGFFQQILEAQAPESAQKNINLKILNELKVIVPSIELQNQFAAFVKQTEKTKATIGESLEKLETLKKALMQEYFG